MSICFQYIVIVVHRSEIVISTENYRIPDSGFSDTSVRVYVTRKYTESIVFVLFSALCCRTRRMQDMSRGKATFSAIYCFSLYGRRPWAEEVQLLQNWSTAKAHPCLRVVFLSSRVRRTYIILARITFVRIITTKHNVYLTAANDIIFGKKIAPKTKF